MKVGPSRRRLLLLALFAVAGAWFALRGDRSGVVACGDGEGARLVVETRTHGLALCEGRRPIETFTVRLGKGGVDKSREGDGKTPLGRYPLAQPRPSVRFGQFVPIGYPTDHQRAQGFTGSAVGVHGPHRATRWLGSYVNAADTTDGCVGLATDDEMARVAAWVERARPAAIELR